MPIKINVPFNEKDEAKKLGAVWVPDVKTWVIPNSIIHLKHGCHYKEDRLLNIHILSQKATGHVRNAVKQFR